ncbi:hypothetical protein L9F63_003810 [Diploptera punctata]|uniref:ascorbate ferrireductase (transmembrane) n=1 Tax=Diploptera punctata TaxID=6984 RepID=A0AAD7ZJH4_DIPPU|nr:hypothetical protein L9F63_003810 [Diploptera punctata]
MIFNWSYLTTYKFYRICATFFSLSILASYTVYVFYLSFKKYSLFSWHPCFMTLGFTLLITEAVILLSRESIFKFLKYDREELIRKHWILHLLGGTAIAIGLTTIILHKENEHYPHFKTFHSITGLISVILFVLGCLHGIITLYSPNFQSLVKPFKIKFTHVCIGILTFLFGMLSQCSGIFSNFFYTVSSWEAQLTCIILVTIAGVVPFEGAFRSAYSKYKNLIQGWPEDTSSLGR